MCCLQPLQNLAGPCCVWNVEAKQQTQEGGPVSRHDELGEFTDFVTGCQGKMVRLAELLSGDRGRAEDLAQDGFAKAYAAWDRIRGGDPAAYVRRCIVNANTDWWRRRVRYEQPSPQVPEVFARVDLAAASAARDLVLRALAKLTSRERAVLALRFYLDLSELQIARELGISPGTVKSATSRALAKLRADAELRSEVAS
jgi:RNA polymerase sigma-70 factor (sigma-E family)